MARLIIWITVALLLVSSWSIAYHEHQKALEGKGIYPALKVIENQHFKDQLVSIDGNRYKNCTFDNVTFRWHGKPYAFDKVFINGSRNVEVDGDVADVVNFLAALDLLNSEFSQGLKSHGKQASGLP